MLRAPFHAGVDEVSDHGEAEPRGLSSLLRVYWRRIAGLSLSSFLGGSIEAAFLLLLTATALAATSDSGDLVSIRGVELTTGVSVVIGALLIALRVLVGVAVAAQSSSLRASVLSDTRARLGGAYLDASWSAQHGQPPGKLQELLSKFSDRKMALVQNLSNIASYGSSLAAMLLTAAFVEPLGFAAAVVVLVVLAAVLRPVRLAIRRRAKRSAESGIAFATAVSETAQLGMEMHTFHVQDALRARVDERSERNTRAVRRLSFAQGILPVAYMSLAYSALLAGLFAVIASEPTDVAALGAVMVILLRSLSYGQNLQGAVANFQGGLPFLEILDEELATFHGARRRVDGHEVGRVGTIEFRSVSFSYDGSVNALEDVDAEIKERETVGVIGPSGSGKSTFVQLLLGLREPTSGVITADGRPISEFARASWARKVTFVPQQPRLVAGSIEENVRFFRAWVTDEDVRRACRLANLETDIDRMPDGYGTQVGEQGSRLSGGQQQRLVIARALTENPDLLVLDEPTSALDVKSEMLVRKTLEDLSERMSVVIVAHRLSTLDVCDRIMVIRDGRVVDYDTPAALLANSDFYREVQEMSVNQAGR